MKFSFPTYIPPLLVSAFVLSLHACTDFIATEDLQDEWQMVESDTIVLHYRPASFSEAPSPTADEAIFMLQNQELYYRAICDSIGRDFSDRVMIYLFNQDEAEQHIGAQSGGHSIPKFNTVYFSFFHHSREYIDQYDIENMFLGAHELVHVITHQVLGYPGTKLMSESYANWLDGSYARYHISDIVASYRDHEPEKLMTPDDLLEKTETVEQVYYPNAGVFTGFLVKEYGVERINDLFTSGKEQFASDFEKVCNEDWSEMGEKYSRYLELFL